MLKTGAMNVPDRSKVVRKRYGNCMRTTPGNAAMFTAPPRGGRPWAGWCAAWSCCCFNPRPRVGGDPCAALGGPVLDVSIHAPAWGATAYRAPGHGLVTGFNPRPRVGGDGRGRTHMPRRHSFNPRPRVGGDATQLLGFAQTHVSIHAPAWGATRPCLRRRTMDRFQSTPPRGGRPWCLGSSSRPHGVSIHAPAWGATRGRRPPDCRGWVSIHAPAWGATAATCPSEGKKVFQSTPPRGGRRSFV